jgi:hypothetical protein
MHTNDDQKMRTVHTVRLGSLTLGFCLMGFAGLTQAAGQDTATQSHTVTVKSDPPGAMIWKKEGRGYSCTNTSTPGTVELAFHDLNDLQRLRVRRFGYSAKDLDVKSTDKEVGSTLGQPYFNSFLLTETATPDLIQLNASLKKEFEQTLLTDPEAFRCAPFDLYYIHLSKDKETGALVLNVVLWLDRSFGGFAFRQASHAFNAQERHQKMGQIALDNGIAELLGRFHHVAAKFPDVKTIFVSGIYFTTEAYIDTEKTRSLYFVTRYVTDYRGTHPVQEPVWMENENDVVKNQDAKASIAFVMPAAQIPDTLDTKAISDAVLATGKIIVNLDVEE